MSQLIKLRRKIKSIKTTHKITYAMRLIAMSLYSKLEKVNSPVKYYNKTLDSIFDGTINYLPNWDSPILFPKDFLNTTPLIILIASTKGFCGGFNANLFRFFKRDFFAEEHQSPKFITVGHKSTKFLKGENLGEIIYSFDTLNSQNYLFITKELTKIITGEKGPFSSITAYSNFFINFFVQKPKKSIITPVVFDNSSEQENPSIYKPCLKHSSKDLDELIWEGNKNEIMDFLANRYIRSTILNVLFQGLLAEQAARFLAMDGATNNAEKFLDALTLEYNKSRQALITKELLELSTSFAAFSG